MTKDNSKDYKAGVATALGSSGADAGTLGIIASTDKSIGIVAAV